MVDHSRQSQSPKQWQGYQLYAVDGCRIRLPNEAIIKERFGSLGNGKTDHECPMGLASACYDVMNDLVVDATMAASWSSERTMARGHFKAVSASNALFLYDRGYPAFWFMKAHQEKPLDFCMRSPWNLFKETRDFYHSGKRQKIVWLKPTQQAKALCQANHVSDKSIKVRLVRVDLPDKIEILITSVTDRKRIHHSEFNDLYHKRWVLKRRLNDLRAG